LLGRKVRQHPRFVLFHLNHLNDVLQGIPIGPAGLCEELLRAIDRLESTVEGAALSLKSLALELEGFSQIRRRAAENCLDFFQRATDKCERRDLLQADEFALAIEAIAGCRAPAGPKEAEAVVVVQGAHGDAGALSELLNLHGGDALVHLDTPENDGQG